VFFKRSETRGRQRIFNFRFQKRTFNYQISKNRFKTHKFNLPVLPFAYKVKPTNRVQNSISPFNVSNQIDTIADFNDKWVDFTDVLIFGND
jgi:hypothetical protein